MLLGRLSGSRSKLLIPMSLAQAYANSKGVKIVGDIPIYVGGQSADVWAYQALFELGKGSQPLMVSGVPPDAFSDTGQLWGSPLYDWKVSPWGLPSLPRKCNFGLCLKQEGQPATHGQQQAAFCNIRP